MTLTPGATPEGTAMTPIAPVDPDQEAQPRGLIASLGAGVGWLRSQARSRCSRRAPVQDDERAPLVGSSGR